MPRVIRIVPVIKKKRQQRKAIGDRDAIETGKHDKKAKNKKKNANTRRGRELCVLRSAHAFAVDPGLGLSCNILLLD